mmetsp:Transcript_5178/g.22970  ORF Transcript_5178/g.22970 Transcript_5178/m.22970 type:complete len:224 (-) Transcript_5178:731-1402(-)
MGRLEHVAHVRHFAHVPAGYILVEVPFTREKPRHVGHERGVPGRHVHSAGRAAVCAACRAARLAARNLEEAPLHRNDKCSRRQERRSSASRASDRHTCCPRVRRPVVKRARARVRRRRAHRVVGVVKAAVGVRIDPHRGASEHVLMITVVAPFPYPTVSRVPFRVCALSLRLPSRDVCIEDTRVVKHPIHLLYLPHIPVADVIVELVRTTEHIAHIGNLAHVP